jgi:hypothetical protein
VLLHFPGQGRLPLSHTLEDKEAVLVTP